MSTPIPNQPAPNIQCGACGYEGKVLVAHHGYKWWMLPVGFLMACTGIGLIPLAIIFIWLGNQTFRACPNCSGREQLAPSKVPPTAAANEVFAQAKAADDTTFKRNKLLLFAVVMAMLAAAVVFMVLMLQNI